MSQILRFTADQRNITDLRNTTDQRNITDLRNTTDQRNIIDQRNTTDQGSTAYWRFRGSIQTDDPRGTGDHEDLQGWDISGLGFDRENWRIMDHWKDLTFIRAHLIHTSGDSRLRP